MILWILGSIALLALLIVVRLLSRKSALDAASSFLKSRNQPEHRDWD